MKLMNYRAVRLYLNGKLKEEQEFAKTRTEEIDIAQSKEFIESLENALSDTEVQEMVKEWNNLYYKMEELKNKASKKDYDLGKYFEHCTK